MKFTIAAAYLAGAIFGAATAATAQRYADERDFLSGVERFRAEARRAGERCDAAAIDMARAMLEYRGGPRRTE